MSEYSQPLSTCSRTTDFSFCFNNSAFSDAVLVLLTLRPKGASITWRLASSVAQLFVSAVEVGATTLTATIPVDPKYGKTLGALSRTVVSGLSPKDGQEVAISTVYQVNSALLAASSPYLRQLIQHPPQLHQLVPGLSSVAARHRQRKLVTVLIQPHHVAAAEHVVRFIFTNDIALTSAQQALDALLVAEQLQVPDCAEVCQHYLEDCSMDWPVALTLVHLQHKHQQEQHQQRQQQWQQQQQPSANLPRTTSGTSIASARRPGQRTSLHSRSSMSSSLLRGLGGSGANGLDAVAPPLPVPSESVYLQGLLLRAQDFLVHEFEDLELVLASAEGRQRLLLLPYDALRAILGHPSLKVASENTALLAAAGWLQANAAQVGSLLLNTSSRGSSGGSSSGFAAYGSKGDEGCVQTVYSSSLYTNSGSGVDAPDGAAAAPAASSSAELVKQNGSSAPGAAAVQPQGAAAPPTASGAGSLLLDLCQVLRLCQCSYTYILHVLPQLPLFRDEPRLVAALQFEVLRFRAAGKLRQRRLAGEAAAAAAAAAAANPGLTGHHLAGLEQQQQQPQQLFVKASAGGSGSDSSIEPTKVAPAAGGPWPAAGGNARNALATAAPGGQGWRSGCTVDAALLQCQPRPESARSTLDFSFTFDPQVLAGPDAKGGGRSGSNGAAAGSSSSSSGGGCSSGNSGVDLMQRLLGLTPQQNEDTTVMSEDQYFAGYVWNLVVAADGFVGVSWRVVLPGGVDVPLAGPHQSAAGVAASYDGEGSLGSMRLFGPDCAGFRSAEVAVTFSITSSGLSRVQRSNSSSGSLATAAGPSSGGAAGVDAAAVKPGSKADQSIAPGVPAAAGKGAQAAPQQQQTTAMSGGSPVKSSKVVGRAYSEVQFVPAQCAWGFPDFAKAGWDALKGPDGKVCLRCQLKDRE